MPNTSFQAMYWGLADGRLIYRVFKRKIMSDGFIGSSHSNDGNDTYYSREGECLWALHSDKTIETYEDMTARWKEIEHLEKHGNKELGVRGRHDARVRTNFIMALPNELEADEAAERIENILLKTPIKDCTYAIYIHKGEKGGIVNKHAHVLVNERNLQTMKKDRTLNHRDFIKDVLLPTYRQEFKIEFTNGRAMSSKRERIPTDEFWLNPALARAGISAVYSIEEERIKEKLRDKEFVAELKALKQAEQDDKPNLQEEVPKKIKVVVEAPATTKKVVKFKR